MTTALQQEDQPPPGGEQPRRSLSDSPASHPMPQRQRLDSTSEKDPTTPSAQFGEGSSQTPTASTSAEGSNIFKRAYKVLSYFRAVCEALSSYSPENSHVRFLFAKL